MRLLLDTHTVLWWFNGHPSLSEPARAAISDADEAVFVSAVSAMEVATKHRLGKLPEAKLLSARFEEMTAHENFSSLPISLAHARVAGLMSIDHQDPFDRLLIAQALIEDLTVVSNDRVFDAAGVSRLW
ncbi:MAG TPA: type II toxin-antitoxin system VapC family toxin [Caulobacteraceae bacterium]